MFRGTPTGKQAARFLPIVATLVALGFVTKACTSEDPTEVPSDLTVQAKGGSASCAAPCVEVEVVAKGNKPPTDSNEDNTMVVTLLNGGDDPNDAGTGIVGVEAIDQDGIARFTNVPSGGYCAYVTSVTDADVQQGASDNTIPAADLGSPDPNAPASRLTAAPFLGAVSESAKKSRTLNKANYLSNCVDWTDVKDAPFSVDASTALSVKLKVAEAGPSETVVATCTYFDGGDTPQGAIFEGRPGFCPSWGVIDLEGLDLPDWFQDLNNELPNGVKKGLLISAANTNPAELFVPSGQGIALESATTGEEIQETTFSTLADPGDNVTGNVDPTVCFVNDREVSGPAACGIEFLNMQDGYVALSSLNTAGFGFDDENVVIWYDYKKVDGDLTVTMKGRLRENSEEDDGLPSSANFQITVDFDVSCEPGDQPLVSGEVPGLDSDITVQCRPEGNDFRATWVLTIPSTRVLEYRLEAACASSPPPSREDTSGDARWLIEFPTQDNGQLDSSNQCKLPESTIGDDSKFWLG